MQPNIGKITLTLVKTGLLCRKIIVRRRLSSGSQHCNNNKKWNTYLLFLLGMFFATEIRSIHMAHLRHKDLHQLPTNKRVKTNTQVEIGDMVSLWASGLQPFLFNRTLPATLLKNRPPPLILVFPKGTF